MQGVETQSETVWMQANRYNIPRLGFINKLDRLGSSVDTTVQSVKRRLRAEPLLINIPSDDTNQLNGLIDLPSMLYFKYNDQSGKYVDIESLDPSEAKGHDELVERCMTYRENLIEQLSMYDDELADLYLTESSPYSSIAAPIIDAAIKKALREHQTVALFCGSALKNKGVQPLMDGILKYLPCPSESRVVEGFDLNNKKNVEIKANAKDKLRALAFKVVNDREKGLITFFRVYSGVLKNRQKIQNCNLKNIERISALMRVCADEMLILDEIRAGDIGAIVGCKNVRSGDTILEETDSSNIQLIGVNMPPPVFFCSIEAEMSKDKQELQNILFNLSREDPSIQVQEDEETGQLLVSGLGELHLEVLRDRIEIEYGIKAELGKMRVAYRESVGQSNEKEVEVSKTIGGAHMYCKLKISVESTIDEVDMSEVQRQRFEQESLEETEQQSDGGLSSINNDKFSSLGENEILYDFENLEPVSERVKLEGDEYEKSKKRRNRDELTSSANLEIYRSLDTLPLDCKLAMEEAISDALLSG